MIVNTQVEVTIKLDLSARVEDGEVTQVSIDGVQKDRAFRPSIHKDVMKSHDLEMVLLDVLGDEVDEAIADALAEEPEPVSYD